jgi:transcription initiation factor TFIIH subunit 2
MDETHYKELFLAVTTPPVNRTKEQSTSSLLMMGFPSRTLAPGGTTSYCACHSKPCREGYLCTRCGVKVCRLPSECPACGLTLILSTHLARSYHHLFPLRNWVEVPWAEATRSTACFSCQSLFPEPPRPNKDNRKDEAPTKASAKGVSESGRYKCQVCGNHFCIDCDVFAHMVIHNCPGCQSQSQAAPADAIADAAVALESNGNGHINGGVMAIDG